MAQLTAIKASDLPIDNDTTGGVVIQAKGDKLSRADLNPKFDELESKIDGAVSGFKGTIKIADTKTEDGSYTPEQEGTYPLAGGLTYLPTTTDKGYKVTFIKSGAEWFKDRQDVGFEKVVDYAIEAIDGDISYAKFTGRTLSIGGRLIIMSKETAKRAYLQPLGTTYPFDIVFPDELNQALVVEIELLESFGLNTNYLTNEDLKIIGFSEFLNNRSKYVNILTYLNKTASGGLLHPFIEYGRKQIQIDDIEERINGDKMTPFLLGDMAFEQGGIILEGVPQEREDRIRSAGFIERKRFDKIDVIINQGYNWIGYYYDDEGVYIESSSTGLSSQDSLNLVLDEGVKKIKFALGKVGDTNIIPDEGENIKVYAYSNFASKYDIQRVIDENEGIPSGGVEGDVLTPQGWSSSYANKQYVIDTVNDFLDGVITETELNNLLSGYVTSGELNTIIQDYVKGSSLDAITGNFTTLAKHNQDMQDVLKTTDTVSNISDKAVTPANLSTDVMDLLAASGAVITNQADGEDLESVGGLIKLKGEGVNRFRAKTTPDDNYSEFLRLKALGGTIQIKDSIDLSHNDGRVRIIDVTNVSFKFVGDGRIKNCRLVGAFSVDAGLNQIFENVHFGEWSINSEYQDRGNDVYSTVSLSQRTSYNTSTKNISQLEIGDIFNPFKTNFPVLDTGSFVTPTLNEDGKYQYQDTKETYVFEDGDAAGTVKIPIRRDYLFINKTTNEVIESTVDLKSREASYTEIEADNLEVSRLYYPEFKQSASLIVPIRPEWFGGGSVVSDNSEAFQNMLLIRGSYQLASGAVYEMYGDVTVYADKQVWQANKATLKMRDNSTKTNLLNIENRKKVDGFTVYDLNIDGNKSNQVIEQDGIFNDYYRGQYPFNGYSMNNTYWYNLDVRNFSGTGIFSASPGTSHIYSTYVAYNGLDGIRFLNEHFTLTNVTCWSNGRHGAFAGGNHWRIIGGAYAHNGAGSNIHCKGAFESQIIGCSAIHSGKFSPKAGGGYVASTLNVYGYVYEGEGLGTHELIGGHGIYLENARYITIIGARVINHNADGIHMGSSTNNIILSSGLLLANNMTKGDWKDVGGINAGRLNISASMVGRKYTNTAEAPKSMELIYFGESAGDADWNDLKTSLGDDFKLKSVYNVRDSWAALNRPSGATSNLFGTISIGDGASRTLARVLIELTGSTGVKYFRWVTIRVSDGVYADDTGWKSLTYS